ncbi:MAG: sulfite exporter TauE/SafE family protein [candidate division KSB1 bacterium]|nr:sulfite exporter TauE/SafE family protein [candidate division KSB1 bacterium]MDZ7339725.1 sulfite exporter TauE/SafE family protein [candidate division KSB1 bacterium]
MDEGIKLAVLFMAGLLSGFINVMAGGGSTLTLPALIFLGLDSSLANGTNRVAVLIQNIAAIVAFKQERLHQFKLSLKLALLTLPGAILGALVAVKISDSLFQRLLGIVIMGIIITLIFPQSNRKNGSAPKQPVSPIWLYGVMFGIGFYGGFIQAGVGFLLMAAFYHLLQADLLHVNMHKVFVVFIFTLPAIVIFILTDNISWVHALVLSAGNGLGAWCSAKVSVKKGEGVIRGVLLIAMFIMALKLLNIF